MQSTIKILLECHGGDVNAAAQVLIEAIASPKREYEDDNEDPNVITLQGLASRSLWQKISQFTTQERFDYFNLFASGGISYDERVFFDSYPELDAVFNDVMEFLLAPGGNLEQKFEWSMSMLSYVYMNNIEPFAFNEFVYSKNLAKKSGSSPTLAAILVAVLEKNVNTFANYVFIEPTVDELESLLEIWFMWFAKKGGWYQNGDFWKKYSKYIIQHAYEDVETHKITTDIFNFMMYITFLLLGGGIHQYLPFKKQNFSEKITGNHPHLRTIFPDFSKDWVKMSLYEYLDHRLSLDWRDIYDNNPHGGYSYYSYNLVMLRFGEKIFYPELANSVGDVLKFILNLSVDEKSFQEPLLEIIYFETHPWNYEGLDMMDTVDVVAKETLLIDFAYEERDNLKLFGNFDFNKTSILLQYMLKNEVGFQDVLRYMVNNDDFFDLEEKYYWLLFKKLYKRKSYNNTSSLVYPEIIKFLNGLSDPNATDFSDVVEKMFGPRPLQND